jgi:hypothetical protein
MRVLVIAAFATLALAGTAGAEPSKCTGTLDGGWRCVGSDGHVTERRPVEGGGERTTSTDPKQWGTSDGHGRGVTPPDAMIRSSPTLRAAMWGRVTDPWEPRKAPVRAKGGWGVR